MDTHRQLRHPGDRGATATEAVGLPRIVESCSSQTIRKESQERVSTMSTDEQVATVYDIEAAGRDEIESAS